MPRKWLSIFAFVGINETTFVKKSPLWEAAAAAASVLPKRPVRITAGEGLHTEGTGDGLVRKACIHCQFLALWEPLHFPQSQLLTNLEDLIPTKGIFATGAAGAPGLPRWAGRWGHRCMRGHRSHRGCWGAEATGAAGTIGATGPSAAGRRPSLAPQVPGMASRAHPDRSACLPHGNG
jgi:hypothetical protein